MKNNNNGADRFIQAAIKGKIPATVFLTNGVKLNGMIMYYDGECAYLARDGVTQLVFRHAIGTVMPQEAIELGLDEDEGDDPRPLVLYCKGQRVL